MLIGCRLYKAKVCSNSIAWAKENIDFAPDGSVFIVEKLTNAYGRNGRIWSIKPGQILITILLRPTKITSNNHYNNDITDTLNKLTMALCVGITNALETFNVGIKWPNDFIKNNKKVGGMVMHTVWENQKPKGIILGFGINVNTNFEINDPLHLTAGSLRMDDTNKIDENKVLKNILQSLDNFYKLWTEREYDLIYKQWRDKQLYIGKQVTIHQKDTKIITGIAKDVCKNGDLIFHERGKANEEIIPFCTVQDVVIVEL